jgi:ADP-heptose:LPS heptosyltransferase
MRIENATFYSLQKGAAAGQIAQLKSEAEIVDLAPELIDFAVTAAAIANLDVVISVDTSIAHLAGGMGKPVWVLLHRAPDWRWLLERETSPWYPTARLFRQRTPGKWKEVLSRVESELRQLASSLPRAVSTESSAGTR